MDNQFDNLYPLKVSASSNPSALQKERLIEDEQKRLQSGLKTRPSNISFYENLMYARDFSKKSGPRVGYLCNMIPREIIESFGAEAIRLDCGNGALSNIGEEVLAGDICPLSKATFGSLIKKGSLAESCDILIIPASCDAKRKLGEILNDIKPVFMLNLPPEQNHSLYAKETVKELFRLIGFLEKQLKTGFNKARLLQNISAHREVTSLVRDFHKIRINKPDAVSITDFFLIIQSLMFRPADLHEWISETKKVLQEIQITTGNSNKSRLVLTGSPLIWPNFKVLNLIEESGASVIADTLCTGLQSLFDLVQLDEKNLNAILRSLASRYIFSSICPCFISQTRRLNRVMELLDETKAKGVINFSLRLCPLFDMENLRLEKTLKNKNVPYLNLRTDYSLEDREQLRMRIEAFLEKIQ